MNNRSKDIEREIEAIEADAILDRQKRVLEKVLGTLAVAILGIAIAFGWMLWDGYQTASRKELIRSQMLAAEAQAAAEIQKRENDARRVREKCLAERLGQQEAWKQTLSPSAYLDAVLEQPTCP